MKVAHTGIHHFNFDGSLHLTFISYCLYSGTKECLTIGEQVLKLFSTQQVTIATLKGFKSECL